MGDKIIKKCKKLQIKTYFKGDFFVESGTLILNSKSDNNFKAILNLKDRGGDISFFNFKLKNHKLALGIRQDNKVHKIPITISDSKCAFKNSESINFDKPFSCAVVDVTNPLYPDVVLCESKNSFSENQKIESAFLPAKQDINLYEISSQQEIEDLIDKNLEDDLHSEYFDACSKCKYREAFYSDGKSIKQPCDNSKQSQKNQILTTSNYDVGGDFSSNLDNSSICDTDSGNLDSKDLESKDSIKGDNPTFYEQIKSQMDAMFDKYDSFDTLSSIIPNSKWIKVVYDESNNFYVLGLIYREDGGVLYICYGVPSNDPQTPPDDIKDYAGWLPLDSENVDSQGFFIVCQDATTGETLKTDLFG